MNGNVLILNQDYQPLNIVNVRKSIMLLFLDKAELLHESEKRKIRTINTEYSFPLVIRLKRYARVPYQYIVLSRRNILRRDSNKCQYCGSTSDLTIDHIIPKSRGGGDTWENLTTACNKCNNRKGNRTPKEANMVLKRKPYRPSHILFLREYNGTVHDTWKPYLYM